MPFIGKQPKVGAYQLIDSITTSATATYALTVNGTAFNPESARNLIVSLNGITQAPESAYTVSGSNIVFDSALTSSDVIDYILVIGDAVDIGTPSDGTVGTAQMNYPLGNFSSTGIDDNADSVAITVDSSERVGIGTTSPAALLHINGSGDAVRVTSTNEGVGGAQVDLLHFGGSPADGDDHASINFGGYYSGTTSSYGSAIRSNWTDVSARQAALKFFTRDGGTFSERMRIQHSGGISFNGDTAASNALDDYEEGTWTPQMLGYAQPTPASQTYSAQEGHYVKIGRLVVASYAVQLSNKGNMSGNYVLLAGWPFSRESANFDCGISYFNNMSTSVNSMWWELTNSYGWLAYVQTSGNTASTYMTTSGISNSTRISGSVAYITP